MCIHMAEPIQIRESQIKGNSIVSFLKRTLKKDINQIKMWWKPVAEEFPVLPNQILLGAHLSPQEATL